MIYPAKSSPVSEVARHYDDLDHCYRSIWGEHVHHGAWFPGDDLEDVEAATLRLLDLAINPLRLSPGARVVDIGCGYGATARWLAARFGAAVTALTISERQYDAARDAPAPGRGRVRYRLADWLDNNLPDASFDAAVAIESLAHMPDKGAFFREIHRTLKPGGRAAIACWTAAPDPSPLESLLLRRICTDGCLPSVGSDDDYQEFAAAAKLVVRDRCDLSQAVEPTWRIITRRVLGRILRRPRELRALGGRVARSPLFSMVLPVLLLAYRTGAFRYSLLWLHRPSRP